MEDRIALTTGSPHLKGRDPSLKPTDKSALYAIAQAAIDVELFTIPLYMSTLYSIQGMHEINSKGLSFYKERLWPGLATTAQPSTPNEKVFNIIFSVFIEEMLHLQLAADIASAIGAPLTFTSSALQTPDNGWTCYGPEKTMIPRILDLRDTTTYANVKVDLAPLNREQIELLLAIEEPDEIAKGRIRPDRLPRYFPIVPFAAWQPKNTEKDLPLFGSIGWMYQCYADYTDIAYSDGTTLWDYVFVPKSPQRDLFNVEVDGHPAEEYPGFEATVSDAERAHTLVKEIMCAITDQGEGSLISQAAKKQATQQLQQTLARYAPNKPAMEVDYPSYDASGNRKDLSDDASARYQPGLLGSELDHYERFQEIRDKLLKDVVTWDKWRPGEKNKWTAKDLCLYPEADQTSNKIPSPDAVAQALNRLAADATKHQLFSQVCVGSIKGITTVLDQYWQFSHIPFPNPSMWGSGDRVAICWAIFGKAPDLSQGIKPPGHDLQHSCQGLDFNAPGGNCAAFNVYHTCKGSNACRAQGGCGFVHSPGGCGAVQSHRGATAALGENRQAPTGPVYNAPGDNSCKAAGGCAVPISASQFFPSAGQMQPLNFQGSGPPVTVGKPFEFSVGNSVYDTAWKTYVIVMKARGQNPGTKPAPNDLRLAFPPST